jgi:hypothetical protein
VLQRHREERDRSARAAVPELPQPILRLFEQLWVEVWRQADAIADADRQAHALFTTETSQTVFVLGIQCWLWPQ